MTCALVALAGAATMAAPALAVPACPDPATPRDVLTGQGVLESVIVDDRGRLYFADTDRGVVLRVDAPGARPEEVLAGVGAGGMAFLRDGDLIVGGGDGIAGNVRPTAELTRLDLETNERSVYATGLQMANGVVRGADGSVYASNDFGFGIDRVAPDGTVAINWARVFSPNGLAIDPSGRYLYAAQTFQPPAIARIDLTNPADVQQYAAGAPEDLTAGLDGMTIDQDGRLYVAANAGEVWRVGTDRSVCVLASGLSTVSAVAFGTGRGGRGFGVRNLYAVTFGGRLVELADVREEPAGGPGSVVRPAPPPRDATLHLTASPRRVRAGRTVVVTLRATRRIGRTMQAAPRMTLRFAGRTLRTDARGIARVRLRFRRPGRYVAEFRYGSSTAGTAVVTVLAARRRA